MGWIQKLYETYEQCYASAGTGPDETGELLLPISHSTQLAHIEITLSGDGLFRRARVIPKAEAKTVIPCTESSGGRTGRKPVSHPLCDSLQYVAKGYAGYGGVVTSGYADDPAVPYRDFCQNLRQWCESKYGHPKAQAVLNYVEAGTMIPDLVQSKVLILGENEKLLEQWDGDEEATPLIFTVLPGGDRWQGDAFIRWQVEIPGDSQSAVWKDLSLHESWIGYYGTTKAERGLCYVRGIELPLSGQHPAKLRNDADKAKLISSNDMDGFTFRGRFDNAGEACGIGYDVTQKAHNALRWLLRRQGYRYGTQMIVAWATDGKELPDPWADTFDLVGADQNAVSPTGPAFTAQDIALRLNKKMAGYKAELGLSSDVVVMGIDAANPGRMSISFYRELRGSDLLDRIERWHQTCCWTHSYRTIEVDGPKAGKKKSVRVRFVGAPSPKDIAKAAYAIRKEDDPILRRTVERIIPCIIDGQPLPADLVHSAVQRAANPISLENWEWEKVLSIACALYRKYREKEVYGMALEETRKTRDYLYGRLLALADNIEGWALSGAGEKRPTNAMRLMQRFAEYPFSTWRTIELALAPSLARLGGKSVKRQRQMGEVMALFDPEDFVSDKKLNGEFLLGFHCQRAALWTKGDNSGTEADATEEAEEE